MRNNYDIIIRINFTPLFLLSRILTLVLTLICALHVRKYIADLS